MNCPIALLCSLLTNKIYSEKELQVAIGFLRDTGRTPHEKQLNLELQYFGDFLGQWQTLQNLTRRRKVSGSSLFSNRRFF